MWQTWEPVTLFSWCCCGRNPRMTGSPAKWRWCSGKLSRYKRRACFPLSPSLTFPVAKAAWYSLCQKMDFPKRCLTMLAQCCSTHQRNMVCTFHWEVRTVRKPVENIGYVWGLLEATLSSLVALCCLHKANKPESETVFLNLFQNHKSPAGRWL